MSLTTAKPPATATPERPILTLVRDHEPKRGADLTASSETSVGQQHAGQSRNALFNYFAMSLGNLLVIDRKLAVDPDLASSSLKLVYALLDDDFPTPQVSPGPEDGIAVEWLVNGESLTIHLVSTSDIRMWAEAADGTEIFDFELNRNWTDSSASVMAARNFLQRLKENVQSRLTLRT